MIGFKIRGRLRTRRWDRYWQPIRDRNDCDYYSRLRLEFLAGRLATALTKASIRSNGVPKKIWAEAAASALINDPALSDVWERTG